MIKILKTSSENKDFISLVNQLDADLAIRDGDEHSFYHQFNKIDSLKQVLIVFENEKALSCGALKPLDENHSEIKRMYTIEEARGKGLASKVLKELEIWSKELGFTACRLETGIRQPEAISLYQKNLFS